MLKAGEYRNASEAMRDAIRAPQQRRTEEALKLDYTTAPSRAGISARTTKMKPMNANDKAKR
jgi:antitoxin ParD1/3/4